MTERAPSGDFPTDRLDAVCVGETMASFVATDDPRRYLAIAAGAESNVAIGMARLGCRVRWVSRIGDDPLGRLVEASVAASGVEVSVVRDPTHPTGVMVKHPAGAHKHSSYYRSESAARSLEPGDLERIGDARWIHVTGITPALSDSAHRLVQTVVSSERSGGHRVSFDVNYRPSLWSGPGSAAETILPIARRADLVFIGDDEADALLGTSSASRVGEELLTEDHHVVVLKEGSEGATAMTRDAIVSIPAMAEEPIDVTGAGDAFAAGFLAATCFEWPTDARLRLGHLAAARVIRQLEDAMAPLTEDELDELSPSYLERRWRGIPRDDARRPSDGASA